MKTNRAAYFVSAFFALIFLSCHDHSHEEHSTGQHKDSTVPATTMDNMPGMEGMNHNAVDHSEMLLLTAREQLLAGIRVDTVQYGDFQQSVTALGIVAIDESTVSVITAKVKGRIDRLYVRNPGEDIRSGQPLYDLYSETLLAEEQDLVQFIQSNASKDIVDAAKQKLKLYGLSDAQVTEIEKQKSVTPEITIYSSASGFLSDLPAREGQYVETGDVLFEIASLNEVRINAQVYPGEIASFTNASRYVVESGSGQVYDATKLYDNPALETNSKILSVKLRVSNPDHLLRPGMMTTVHAVSGAEKLLMIPQTALLIENGMSFTWVQEPDGMFSRRMISTGKENETDIEVTDGLKQGDHIVVSGIYLLNSEYILRKGANAMGGMKM